MGLAELPGRQTPICVQCVAGPAAYVRGGFDVHVSCIPGLRDYDDILALYVRQRWIRRMASVMNRGSCVAFPVISAITPANSGFNDFSNTIVLTLHGRCSCGDAGAPGHVFNANSHTGECLLNEITAGANLSRLYFCLTVKGR